MTTTTYITLTEAKDHLGIDDGLTIHDQRIQNCIGGAIDWAENYTQRSLAELIELNSPVDSPNTPAPDPVDSPGAVDQEFVATGQLWGDWAAAQTQAYWAAYLAANPVMQDHSMPLRRDVKQGIMLMMEKMFDRNVANFADLQDAAENLLHPYRIGLGV